MIGRYHGYFPGAELSDGNCLFEALAIAIFGASFHHATIRKLLCDYAAANPDRIRQFIAAEGRKCSVASWIAPYRRDGYWGQFVMILLFEEAFDCLVQVFSPDFYTHPAHGPPSFLLPHDAAGTALLHHRPRVSLMYNGSNHYIRVSNPGDPLFTVSETSLLSSHRAAASCKSPSDPPAWTPVGLPDLVSRIRDSRPVPPRTSLRQAEPARVQHTTRPVKPLGTTDGVTHPEKPSTEQYPTWTIPEFPLLTSAPQRPLFSRATHLSPLFGVQTTTEDLSRFCFFPGVLWPPQDTEYSGFLTPPQVLGQGANRVIALIRRPPVANDYIVLSIDQTGTTSAHPSTWQEFSQYAVAAYRVATVTDTTICAELPTW